MDAAPQPPTNAPLSGTLVLDLSRMLPGAVLARQLLDLGARLIKIEAPEGGDPMRFTPPLVGGTGVGFTAFFRGAESVCLDLREEANAAAVERISRTADVLIESFRPGTLERWGLGPDRLLDGNSALVVVSLPGFRAQGPLAGRVGHDLNFVAESGLLSLLPGDGVPRVQMADVTTGLLATGSILAALLRRERTGRGCHIEQPLSAAPMAWLTWAWAAAAAGGESTIELLLSGRAPCYRLYTCGDGLRIALGAIEPKFWISFLEMLDLGRLAAAGLDPGEEGRRAAAEIERVLASRPREHWLRLAEERNLPVSACRDLAQAQADPSFRASMTLEEARAPGGEAVEAPAPALALGATPERRAPALGEHTELVLEEFCIPR